MNCSEVRGHILFVNNFQNLSVRINRGTIQVFKRSLTLLTVHGLYLIINNKTATII